MDMVLEFLGCRADSIGDGDECFEEIGKFFRREDDERDSAEDDEFLPADVEHGGIVGGVEEDCKGLWLWAGSGIEQKKRDSRIDAYTARAGNITDAHSTKCFLRGNFVPPSPQAQNSPKLAKTRLSYRSLFLRFLYDKESCFLFLHRYLLVAHKSPSSC